eukprot:gnl/TRDRNA2_/TRDRNA2_197242_c0_seq1.p1 gnl/TRDRNA2_/TRDRNA2_197242_c0~~gnl/TRDRNA2_/TRDRNA2_197242_c0_seq1.p1  ORF type:complete len:285 (+),score=63.03 gnl/TRDRNA2_/TRDRNA2_197242_c0_seq1:90-944(+)
MPRVSIAVVFALMPATALARNYRGEGRFEPRSLRNPALSILKEATDEKILIAADKKMVRQPANHTPMWKGIREEQEQKYSSQIQKLKSEHNKLCRENAEKQRRFDERLKATGLKRYRGMMPRNTSKEIADWQDSKLRKKRKVVMTHQEFELELARRKGEIDEEDVGMALPQSLQDLQYFKAKEKYFEKVREEAEKAVDEKKIAWAKQGAKDAAAAALQAVTAEFNREMEQSEPAMELFARASPDNMGIHAASLLGFCVGVAVSFGAVAARSSRADERRQSLLAV